MTKEELIEQLADKEHASWARWQDYFFSKCHMYIEGEHLDYSRDKVYFSLPRELVARWKRQIATPYAELSEQEKQSDRDEVAHILPIIEDFRDTLLGEMFEAWKRKNPILAQSFPVDMDINANLELVKWRLEGLKESMRVLEDQLDNLFGPSVPGKERQFWLQKLPRKE